MSNEIRERLASMIDVGTGAGWYHIADSILAEFTVLPGEEEPSQGDSMPEDALDIPCPLCGALAGQHCVTPSRAQRKNNPHKERHTQLRLDRATYRSANRKFASRDGNPGEVWLEGVEDDSAKLDISRTSRIQFVTEDNIISIYFDSDGCVVVNGDRSFNLELGASNHVKIAPRA